MNLEGGENPWEVKWLGGENWEVNCLEVNSREAKYPGTLSYSS